MLVACNRTRLISSYVKFISVVEIIFIKNAATPAIRVITDSIATTVTRSLDITIILCIASRVIILLNSTINNNGSFIITFFTIKLCEIKI